MPTSAAVVTRPAGLVPPLFVAKQEAGHSAWQKCLCLVLFVCQEGVMHATPLSTFLPPSTHLRQIGGTASPGAPWHC
jgi:hypothetical protein